MKHNTFNLLVNNKTLHGEYWQPEQPKAVVVLLHGMGEHLGRYTASVIPSLIKYEYAVVAYDQFGHGKTDGKKGHTSSYNALLDSLDTAINNAKTLFPGLPVMLYGHSMGGNVVINYVLRRQPEVTAVIATSPLLRLAFNPPKWKLTLGKLLLKVFPSMTMPSELDVTSISREEHEVERYKQDALVHDRISPMYSFPVFDAGEFAIANAEKLNIPMLVCHGTGDQITNYKASEEFCNNSDNAELKLYKDGYHELHHDLCKEDLLDTIVAWLDSKI